ncbi:UNVERIFIED_CONTAM: LuxR family transcriptional regulator [Williamsia faeni]
MCVGRDRELGALAAQLAATATDGALIVAVRGDNGIGKSTLVQALADRHSGPVWSATTAPWETSSPGAVLHQLFQQDLSGNPLDVATQIVDHVTAATASTNQGLVIIDDAEQSDELSLQALTTAVRHHCGVPMLVVLTFTDPTASAVDLASDIIVLCGLDSAAIGELARSRGVVVHPAMVPALAVHTGGNPRYVAALLDEVPAHVWTHPGAALPAPSPVVSRVRKQLDDCGPQGRSLVEALAILGERGSFTEAAALADSKTPLIAIDEGKAAGLLIDAPEPSRSHTAVIRDRITRVAVLDIMGAAAAGRAHLRAADVVDDPVRSLIHRVSATATPDRALADATDALARERGNAGAWAEAAGLFREAFRLSTDRSLREDRLIRTADALVAAGDIAAALALVPDLEALTETALRDAVLAYLAIVRGRAAEAEIRMNRAWDIVDSATDPASAALIAQRHVLHSLSRCGGVEVVEWADRALSLAQPDSPAAIEAEAIRGLGLASSGRPDLADDAYRNLEQRVHPGVQAQRVSLGRGWLQLANDDVDGARTNLETAVATAHMGGSARISMWAYGWLARLQFLTGDWDQALHTVADGRQLAESSGIVLATPLLEWTAAQVHVLRGSWDLAGDALRAAEAVTQDYEIMRAPALIARAQIAEANADYGAVIRALDPVRAMSPGTALAQPGFWPWADVLANALVVDGQLATAESFLDSQEELARQAGHRSTQARLGYARGRLLGATGDLHGARRAFENSLTLLDGLPLRYDLARINFAYGQTLRRAGKRRSADPVLAAARDIYASLGATTYVERCDRELRAGGVNATLSRSDVELTPQEEAVTRLVAQGLSNKEVAAELYVSPKTVQYHLTRIYSKLGVRSRVDLANRYH